MKIFSFLILLSIIMQTACSQKPTHKKETSEKNKVAGGIPITGIIPNLSDSALLDLVQRQTFRYFWDFAHPVSGMSRERSNEAYNYGNETVTIGGTGFGVMSVIVAVERKW